MSTKKTPKPTPETPAPEAPKRRKTRSVKTDVRAGAVLPSDRFSAFWHS